LCPQLCAGYVSVFVGVVYILQNRSRLRTQKWPQDILLCSWMRERIFYCVAGCGERVRCCTFKTARASLPGASVGSRRISCHPKTSRTGLHNIYEPIFNKVLCIVDSMSRNSKTMQDQTLPRGFLWCALIIQSIFACFAAASTYDQCDRCLLGSYNASTYADCDDRCHTSDCSACDASILPRFAIWGVGCNVTGCRGGYVKMVDATSTTVCFKVLEGRWYESSEDAYLNNKRDVGGISEPFWPPSLAYPSHTTKSPYVSRTGHPQTVNKLSDFG
jgi:hypothetical protein